MGKIVDGNFDGQERKRRAEKKAAEILDKAKPKRSARSPRGNAVRVSGTKMTIGQIAGGNIHNFRTNKIIHKTIAKTEPGTTHISEEQMGALHKLVDEIVRLEGLAKKDPATHRRVWHSLNRKIGIGSARLMPIGKFPLAKSYLNQWLAQLSNRAVIKKRAPNVVRKRRITAIQSRCNELNIQEWRKRHMQDTFNKASMTALTDSELEVLYRDVMNRK